MAIYTSRFSNPELRKEYYTAVRIATGAPKWDLGYKLDGELKELMPFGLLGKYDNDISAFKREYFVRLERIGVDRIIQQLRQFESDEKDVVLLCWEDVRKGEKDWCHRTMFAEWWLTQTGEIIEELHDPTNFSIPKMPKSATKPVFQETIPKPTCEQIDLF